MWGPGVGAGAAWLVSAPDAVRAAALGAPAAAGGGALNTAFPAPTVVPPHRGATDGLAHGSGESAGRQWDDLDLVLGMDGGAGGGLEAGAGGGGALRLAAPQEAGHAARASPPLALSGLRCLDAEHLPGCDR